MALSILRAGPLTASYDGGSLRYIRLGPEEVLRRVMVAVRDDQWNTLPAKRSNETITVSNDDFRVEFDASHASFEWHGTIEGHSDGTIHWSMDGAVTQPFLRNRIGFCVLHPIHECAGRACEIEHVNGEREASRFPELISPHQPFRDVRALTHEVVPGGRACVRMEGDIFETEDQRNWSDASFKTYSTPLDLPYPTLVKPGMRIRQSVELRVTGNIEYQAGERPSRIVVDRSHRYPMPQIAKADDFGFVGLNRNRDAVRWSINPCVHAEDELTMIENLAGQAPMVATARHFCGSRPLHLSVRTPAIRCAAGWIAASLSELAQAGANAVSYDGESPVLDEIRLARSGFVFGCTSESPLKCGAIALPEAIWVANFLNERLEVTLDESVVALAPLELRRVAWEQTH